MTETLLQKLLQLTRQKLSKAQYAKKLGVSEDKVGELLKQLRSNSPTKTLDDEQQFRNEEGISLSENRETGVANAQFTHTKEALSDEEIYEECKLSPDRWKLTQIWQKRLANRFQYSANFKSLQPDDVEFFQNKFFNYIKTFKSPYKSMKAPKNTGKEEVAILIPKQDFHFDKKDTKYNSITVRENQDIKATWRFINKASAFYHVKKVFYVLGSDYFNSEFTKATTKGTPQENIGDYHEMFEEACDHEVGMIIEMLEKASEIEVVFIPGNHDYYKCWHLIHFLQAYFRTESRVKFNVDPSLRKYISFGDTAIMLHHGNEIKPQMLANIFPKEFKHTWTYMNNFYIVTGDKHREMINDFGNIRHYGVKALSSSKSFWDEQNGYVGHGEATAFVITENDGIQDIYKQKNY